MLMLHTLVPHTHKGEGDFTKSSRSLSEATSILDFIQIVFLTDLGDGHMEHFKSGDSSVVGDLQTPILSTPVFICPLEQREQLNVISVRIEYPPSDVNRWQEILHSNEVRRGPPSFTA